MKASILAFAFTALFGLGTLTAGNIELPAVTPCEHCAKDHTCDDKCKKGEKSTCCADASKEKEASEKPACCKKGEKSCSKDGKKNQKKEKKGQIKQS